MGRIAMIRVAFAKPSGVGSMMNRCLLVLALLLGSSCTSKPVEKSAAPKESVAKGPVRFELNKGDHVCVIGNTLAERMQHDGWLEMLIHAYYPEHNIVHRDLGYS